MRIEMSSNLVGRERNNADERACVGGARAHQRGELSLLLATLALEIASDLINEYVQDDDDDERGPEVGDDENEREDFVGGPGDVAVLGVGLVGQSEAPAENRGEEEENGQDPGEGHHDDDLVGRAPVAVLGRHAHRAKAVDGDEEHRVDGRQAHGVVEREPQVAYDLALRDPGLGLGT